MVTLLPRARHRTARSLGNPLRRVPRRLGLADEHLDDGLVHISSLFSSFVLGLTLTRQLVVCTTLLLRLIIIMAPFSRRSLSSIPTSWLALWSRSLTSGLLRTHMSFISEELRSAARPTCRSLFLEREPERWPSARQLSFILRRNRRWRAILAKSCPFILCLRLASLSPRNYVSRPATDTLISLATSPLLTPIQPVLPPSWALR